MTAEPGIPEILFEDLTSEPLMQLITMMVYCIVVSL